MRSLFKITIISLISLLFKLGSANNYNIDFEGSGFIQNDSTRMELLSNSIILNKERLKENPSDSIAIYQHLGLAYAELNYPKESTLYTTRYIENSSHVSILERDAYNIIKQSEEFKELSDKYQIKFNLLIAIYLYIALIGFFFAIVINFKKKSDRLSNFLIGGFVVVHSFFILDFAFFASNIRYYYPHVALMSSSVSLLYGPFLYLYFKRITLKFEFSKNDLLHAIPFMVLLVILIPFYRLDGEEKLKVVFDISNQFSNDGLFYTVFIPKLLSYIIYGTLIGKLYFKEKESQPFSNENMLFKWRRNIYNMHLLYMFSYAIYGMSIKGIIINQSILVYHSQMLTMSFMVLYIAQMAYLKPKLFDYKTLMSVNDYLYNKYSKSGLTESLSEELKGSLLNLFSKEKIYKDCNLNLETLASRLETTRHNTSQLINEQFEMNFFELINKFRIEEAKTILRNDTNGNLNIIEIAYEVGYNNKVTFNKAFKKETSQTPTQYLQSLTRDNSSSKSKGIFSRA